MVQQTSLERPSTRDEIPASAPPLALVPAAPEQFARLRDKLRAIGYTTASICERTGSSSLGELKSQSNRPVNDPLDLCIKLFLEGQPVPAALLAEHLAEHAQLLRAVGLVADEAGGLCKATVSLYPIKQLYLVSDSLQVVTGEGGQQSADVVYPALSSNTGEFLDGLPVEPCQRFLDVGAGTGVAALLAAAGWAEHAWALDITARAQQVAAFNAKLNGIETLTVLIGDLFEPVKGMTFDCIVSHPPYMPEPVSRIIFRDGGADGEQITRRLIAGLPEYLSQGGRFYCRCMATDRTGAPLEQRIRTMLGPGHEDFDVLVVTNAVMTPANFYSRLFNIGRITAFELDQQLQRYKEFDAENVVICHVYVRRHLSAQPPLTLRRRLLAKQVAPVPHAPDWLFDWTHDVARPETLAQVLHSRPIVAPEAQVRLTHRMRDGELRAEGFAATTGLPFFFELEASPGTALLLSACDGSRTVATLYSEMQQVGAVPPHATIEQFLNLITTLIGGGILQIESHPLPS